MGTEGWHSKGRGKGDEATRMKRALTWGETTPSQAWGGATKGGTASAQEAARLVASVSSRQGSHVQLRSWNNRTGFWAETASLCVARGGSQQSVGARRDLGTRLSLAPAERTWAYTC